MCHDVTNKSTEAVSVKTQRERKGDFDKDSKHPKLVGCLNPMKL